MQAMEEYHWPGNVRELENVLTRAAIVARGSVIGNEHLSLGMLKDNQESANERDMSMDGAIENQIRKVLDHTHGNKTEAAKLLKISRSRLSRYLERFSI